MTLETAPELKGMVEGDPAVKRIIDFARQLEGVARNASTHAAGIVIGDLLVADFSSRGTATRTMSNPSSTSSLVMQMPESPFSCTARLRAAASNKAPA